MAIATSFSAVVLAAGRSLRMGRDKALLEVDGAPLWRRQRDLLAASGATEIFLSARPEQPWILEAMAAGGFAAVLHDALSAAGPLCGITAALKRATHPHVAVVAIDLARMTPAWFARLAAEAAPGVGAVGRRGELFEPLAAIYPRELMPLAWSALCAGRCGLQPLLQAAAAEGLLRVHDISAEEAELFENWNEPRSCV